MTNEEKASYGRYKAAKAHASSHTPRVQREMHRELVGAIWAALDDSRDIPTNLHPVDVFDKYILRGNVQMDGCDVVERGALEDAKAQGAAEERERLADMLELRDCPDLKPRDPHDFTCVAGDWPDELAAWLRAGGKEPNE